MVNWKNFFLVNQLPDMLMDKVTTPTIRASKSLRKFSCHGLLVHDWSKLE